MPYTVSASLLPSFGGSNRTLALNLNATAFSVPADPLASLECFSISDGTFVSDSVEGTGYDPYPAPGEPVLVQNEKWWGDTVTVQSAYLDPNPAGNLFGMDALKVKADSVTVGPDGFGAEAAFTIPEDARGTFSILEAHGLSSPADYPLILSPRGIGPFTQIRGVTYAPQTGHVWVAADDVIQEIDVFLHDPVVVRTLAGSAKPYISRVTDAGEIFFVEGVTGATTVYTVSVTSGAVGTFRAINDGTFTRLVTPVGIAAAPDGEMCFLADNLGDTWWVDRLVKIPRSPASPVHGTWGGYFWFPDPCGMDAGLDGLAYVSSDFLDGWWIASIQSTPSSPDGKPFGAVHTQPAVCRSLEMDRDISVASPVLNRFYWSEDPGMAHGYNPNEIAGPGGPYPARYLGAEIFAVPSAQAGAGMILSVEFMHSYSGPGGGPHYGAPVILNRAGQEIPYRSRAQVADRLVKFRVRGFPGTALRLRLMDPRDGAPYAPAGGWPATDPLGRPAVPPYEANDNRVWAQPAYVDFGITTDPGGLAPAWTKDVALGPSQDWADLYLKLPERYAGDNWQTEIRRKDPATGALIPNQVPAFTDVYTGWKRVHAERDKMFRRGGVLRTNAAAGQSFLLLYKNPDDTPMDNLAEGDKVAVFDVDHPFEGAHDEAYIAPGGIDPNYAPAQSGKPHRLQLDRATPRGGLVPYTLTQGYTVSPVGTGYYPDFSQGKSAGAGVVNSNDGQITDTSDNQINGAGTAFYDADMRDIQQPFNDAFVEFIAPRSGMGAVLYLPQAWFDASTAQSRGYFSQTWFAHKSPYAPPNDWANQPHNYFHLIGASGAAGGYGITNPSADYSYVFISGLTTGCGSCTSPELRSYFNDTTLHELAHQFRINSCDAERHDLNDAWCSGSSSCSNPTWGDEYCIMHYADGHIEQMREDGIHRLDCDDLAANGPSCGAPACANGISVRTDTDPE